MGIAPQGTAAAEWRAGLPVVVSGLAGMAVQSSGFMSLGTMMVPLVAAFGWPRAQVMAVSVFSAVLSIGLAPLLGALVDRFGARRIALVGAVAYPVTIACVGLAGPGIVGWWAAWLALSVANYFLGPIVWTHAVTRAFVRQRGLALGVVLSGTGIANTVVPLFMVAALDAFGWRGAYFALGGVSLAIALTVTSFCFRVPEAPVGNGSAAGGFGMTLRQAAGTSRYWRLCLAILLASAAIGTLNIHLQPMLIDRGATMLAAAAVASLFGPAQIVGRLAGGFLLDRVPGTLVGAVLFMLPVASCLLLAGGNATGPFGVVVPLGIGLAAGVELDVATYLAGRYFGTRYFSAVYSVIFGAFAIGYSLAPILAAAARDWTAPTIRRWAPSS